MNTTQAKPAQAQDESGPDIGAEMRALRASNEALIAALEKALCAHKGQWQSGQGWEAASKKAIDAARRGGK